MSDISRMNATQELAITEANTAQANATNAQQTLDEAKTILQRAEVSLQSGAQQLEVSRDLANRDVNDAVAASKAMITTIAVTIPGTNIKRGPCAQAKFMKQDLFYIDHKARLMKK